MLLDFKMPRCSGMDVLKALRRDMHRPRVILWSNTLEQVSIPQALRYGADLVCRKPANRVELMDILSRFESLVFYKNAASPACANTIGGAPQAVQL
jgi:CheY-like chemotaxis protein